MYIHVYSFQWEISPNQPQSAAPLFEQLARSPTESESLITEQNGRIPEQSDVVLIYLLPSAVTNNIIAVQCIFCSRTSRY